MTGLFRGDDPVERVLRDGRQRPADHLVRQIEGRIRSERIASRRTSHVALAAVFTAVVVGGLSAVGGASYAASSVAAAAKTVSHVFAPTSASRVVIASWNSGGDQYRPKYCWGCPPFRHHRPPRIRWFPPPRFGGGGGFGGGRGSNGPFLTPTTYGSTAIVQTSLSIDDQADLSISVVNQSSGKVLPITPTPSTIGGSGHRTNAANLAPAAAPPVAARAITYRVLVPRTIPLRITLPSGDLVKGVTYAIKVTARSPDGLETTVRIPVVG